MMQIFGVCIIVLSGVLLGSIPVCRAQQRLTLLDAWESALRQMAATLHSAGLPLAQLLQEVGETGHVLCPYFARLSRELERQGGAAFPELWSETLSHTGLPQQVIAMLMPLGQILGRVTVEDQVQALTACADRLRERYEVLYGNYASGLRVYLSCGTVCGLILGICLL